MSDLKWSGVIAIASVCFKKKSACGDVELSNFGNSLKALISSTGRGLADEDDAPTPEAIAFFGVAMLHDHNAAMFAMEVAVLVMAGRAAMFVVFAAI